MALPMPQLHHCSGLVNWWRTDVRILDLGLCCIQDQWQPRAVLLLLLSSARDAAAWSAAEKQGWYG